MSNFLDNDTKADAETMGRRTALGVLAAGAGTAMGALAGCAPAPGEDRDRLEDYDAPRLDWDDDPDGEEAQPARRNLEALFDTLVPSGEAVSGARAPSASEVGTMSLLSVHNYLPAARSMGLVPVLPAEVDSGLGTLDDALPSALSGVLDGLATTERPFTAFAQLTDDERHSAVDRGFEDPLISPLLEAARGLSMLAYLGGGPSDQGLVALGFPPFDDLAGGLAVAGYPRRPDGRLIDASREDLDALDARGELDDYTYNESPIPTIGDDLSDIVDASGDLF